MTNFEETNLSENFQEKIFDGLNPPQVEAVKCLEGPLLIVAGAGSGKTRVLTCRIANLLAHGVEPREILAITFTNKAANEMKSRIGKMIGDTARATWISTFHSFCARVLRKDIEVLGTYTKNFTIYDASDSKNLIKECITDLGLDADRFTHVPKIISREKSNLVNAAQYTEKSLEVKEGGDYVTQVAKIYTVYEKRLVDNNALDFDDLISVTERIFREHPEVCEKYQDRFRYISIDEYQDTNLAQYRLVKHLAAKYKNICVVGDADQSIYGFRGADMRNILNFEKDYPQAKIIRLEQNYRSTKMILAAANGVITNNVMRPEKNLWTEKEQGKQVRFIHCVSDKTEAAFVAREIKKLVTQENVRYDEIAVLFRTNAQSREFEERFIQADIPYLVVGSLKFYDRKEIKDIVSYLRLLMNPRDNVSFLRIVNVPRRGVGPINLTRLTEFATSRNLAIFDVISNDEFLFQVPQLSPKVTQKLREFAAMILSLSASKDKLPVPAMIEAVLKESGYLSSLTEGEEATKLDSASRVDNLSSFVSSAQDFAEMEPEGTLEDFLNHVALITDVDEIEEENSRVSLMTVHAAKGLEYPTVFLTGMEEGLFPHPSAATVSAMEEERRICYVAITRAEENLYITAAGERRNFGKSYATEVSRFVYEIPRECLATFSERHSLNSNFRTASNAEAIHEQKYYPDHRNRRAAVEKMKAKIIMSAAKEKIDWQPGNQVRHKKWGLGTVMDVQNDTLKILFANPEIGEKNLKTKFAPIEKI